jgi:hypothetical protein
MNPFFPKEGTIVAKIPENILHSTLSKYIDLDIEAKALNQLLKNNKDYTDSFGEYIDKYCIDFQERRREFWLPIYKEVGIPWIYPCKPTLDGFLYIYKDLYNEEIIFDDYKGENMMKNIHDNKPIDGTIIGTLTKEELDSLLEIDAVTTALDSMTTTCTNVSDFLKFLEEYKKIERKKIDTWVPIRKRLGIPWEWDLRPDYAFGNVYIVNYDQPYNEEVDNE